VKARRVQEPLQWSYRAISETLAGRDASSEDVSFHMSTVLYRSDSPYVPQPAAVSSHSLSSPERPGIDRPLRILFSSFRSDPAAPAQGGYLAGVTRALTALGHQVDVVSGPPYPELDAGIRLLALPSPGADGRATPVTLRRTRLDAFLNAYEYLAQMTGRSPATYAFGARLAETVGACIADYDIIHDNQTLAWGLTALRRKGIPVVATIHHLATSEQRMASEDAANFGERIGVRLRYDFLRMQRRVARRLDGLVVGSERAKRELERDFGIDRQKIALVPTAIDCRQFTPRPGVERAEGLIVAALQSEASAPRLLSVIEAFAQLVASNGELELRIISPAPCTAIQDKIARLGLAEKISFTGPLSAEAIADLYSRATVVVAPSACEGAVVAGQAMACGAPIVAVADGSLPELVGGEGELVRPGDTAALTEAMARLVGDPARRALLSRRGRARISAMFGWDRAARALSELYGRVLSPAEARTA
jgi:glycosyltransferase involved in cell wall biosynthesis